MLKIYRPIKSWSPWPLCVIMFLALRSNAHSLQDSSRITLHASNQPVGLVLNQIEAQSGYSFFLIWDHTLDRKMLVTIHADRAPLSQVINALLKGKEITWRIKDKSIVLSKTIMGDDKSKENQVINDSIPKIIIKGTVTSDEGFPLSGATIQVKGSFLGTTSNSQGKFTLPKISDGAKIIISYTGYQTQEFTTKGSETLIVQLPRAIGALDETVVKGYYNTSKRINTGSISRIKAEEISKQPVSNPMAALIGRMPGVLVTQQNGVPGGAFKIQIRGQNSLRNQIDDGNIPLYIVDGVPFNSTVLPFFINNSGAVGILGYSPLNLIDPSDIESIEILKDADATAIYGSRGANGVILITTKKGIAGKTQVDLNFQKGVSVVPRKMDLLNTPQYLEMRKEAFKNDGVTTYPATAYDVNGVWDQQRDTDWQEELIGKSAQYTDASASISGGNINTQYRFGGSYHKETTVFPGDFADQRGAFHLSLTNISSNKKFKSSATINYGANNSDVPSIDLTGTAMKLAPNAPSLFDSAGNLNWGTNYYFGNENPLAYTRKRFNSRTNNLIGNITLSYQVIKNLFIKSSFGYTNTTVKAINVIPLSSFDPADVPFLENNTQFLNSKNDSWIIEPQINWQSNLGIGRLNILVGSTFQSQVRDGVQESASGFASEALMKDIKSANKVVISNTSYSKYRYTAVFGRINYELLGRYIINLTGRRDGSSRFGPEKQFANFGAVGAAWIFSSEDFIANNLKFLSFGKLRSSYGTTGSDNIADYGFKETYASTGQYLGASGLSPQNLHNPAYSWEINRKFEIAIELGFFNDRLFINSSYYHNRSSNQLVGYSLPPTAGFASVQYNLDATVQNTGLEFEISSVILKNRALQWSTALNLTIPRDKLVSYPNLEGSSYYTRYAIGEPLSISRLYEFQGVDPETGVYKVKDVNGDNLYNSADMQSLAFRGQRFYGGLQNNLSYKGFQLDFLFQFVNQKGFNYRNAGFGLPGIFSNQPAYTLNRWQKPGDNTNIQRFSAGSNAKASIGNTQANNSTAKISDASFIRLKNVALSYTIPARLTEILHIKNAKLYVHGQNLFIITKFKGLDPENQNVTSLPPLRVVTAGIQVTL